jgi:TolB protein
MLKDGTALSDLKLRASDPACSRDGKRIALSSNQNSNRFQISVMSLVDRKVAQLTHFQSGDALGPVWSPDDKQIAFYIFRYSNPSREPELYVMDADGGNVRKLADHASEPSWSPDGKSIAFTSAAGGKFDIAVIRIDGSNRKQLTQGTGENSAPAWSPDGSTIAFSVGPPGSQRSVFNES